MNSKKASEKLAREMAAERHKRVLNIKHKLDSGKYKVKNQTLARALFLAL